MTTITVYRNKRNENKYIEVHNDGYYHNSVRQYMEWHERKFSPRGVTLSVTKNFTSDGVLHRWRARNLRELLEDYIKVELLVF